MSLKVKHTAIGCKCLSPHHTLVFSSMKWDDGDKMFSLETILSPACGFFRRCWQAIRYVFKGDAISLSECILTDESAKQIVDCIHSHMFGETETKSQ